VGEKIVRLVPYDVLGVPFGATDEQVRRAYLELLRKTSPDRDPEGFKQLAAAYGCIKTEEDRRKNFLFPDSERNPTKDTELTFDHLCNKLINQCRRHPPSFEAMLKTWRDIR
jgi:hypothetical protein